MRFSLKSQRKNYSTENKVIGNKAGYKLHLYYYEDENELDISLNAPMEMSQITWSTSDYGKMLPTPKSTLGKIEKDDKTGLTIYIGEITLDDYNAYVTACTEKGFTVDSKKAEKTFTASNADGYKLTVDYKGNNTMYISLKEPEFETEIKVVCRENLMFSTYDVDFYIDDDFVGSIEHGKTETFTETLKKGTHTIRFENTDDDGVIGEVEVEITKLEKLEFKIWCYSDKVDIDVVSGSLSNDKKDEAETSKPTEDTDTETPKITMTADSSDYEGRNSAEVEKEFKDMGFTNVVIHQVETTNTTYQNGVITSVDANEEFFDKGDKFANDAKITIYCWKVEKPNSEYELAFVREMNYNLYYMFDTDKKTVVYFGTNDTYIEKGTYTGDFSSGITISWSHGEWTEKFTYKSGSSSATLIDGNGFDWEYEICDVMEAQNQLNKLQ